MKIKKVICALISSAIISLNFYAYADSEITLEAKADKTENIAVGDVISITVTPQSITAEEGICSYDLGAIKFDSSVLAFDSENVSVAHQDYEIYAGENQSGNISLMVVDMSTTGVALHNGEGAATLKFTVISEFGETTVSFANAAVNATLANATLDSVSGRVSSDVVLYSSEAPETPSQTDSYNTNSISLANSTESNITDGDGNNTALVIIIAVAAVCILAAAVALIVRKKKS